MNDGLSKASKTEAVERCKYPEVIDDEDKIDLSKIRNGFKVRNVLHATHSSALLDLSDEEE